MTTSNATEKGTRDASPWYNMFGDRYSGGEPSFYDSEAFPWTAILEENWTVFRDEFLALLERDSKPLKPYYINKGIPFPALSWKTMSFYFWKLRMHRNCQSCPQTVRLLESIPNMTAGSFSVLEPGSSINPHQGDTDAIVRCHLGISIPAGLPDCGFQVGPDIRQWQEGKTLVFCDARTHTAWNQTNERRVIVIVDVIRDEYVAQTSLVCSSVLAASLMQMLYDACPWLKRLPGRFKHFLYMVSRVTIRILLPGQRTLGALFRRPKPTAGCI